MDKLISIWKNYFLKINGFLFRKKIINIPIYPRSIFIRLTNRCNLGCVFCMNAKNRAESVKYKDLTIDDFKSFINELKFYKPHILLTGGEPFLNKDLFKIIRLLRDNNIDTDIFTNGYFIEKNVVNILESGIKRIHISVDHYKNAKHDKLRGRKGVLSKVEKGLAKLKKAITANKSDLKIIISTTISKENYSDLIDFYKYLSNTEIAHSWHLRHLYFYNDEILKENRKTNQYYIPNMVGQYINKKNYFSKEQINILKKQIDNIESHKTKIKVLMRTGINDIIYPYYEGEKIERSNLRCSEAVNRAYIKNNAVYTTCGYKIGPFKNSVYEAWNSKKSKNFQKYILHKSIPQCFRCCGNDYGDNCHKWSY